jgi:hypothetical protein
MAANRHSFQRGDRQKLAYSVEKLISCAPMISQINQIAAEYQA